MFKLQCLDIFTNAKFEVRFSQRAKKHLKSLIFPVTAHKTVPFPSFDSDLLEGYLADLITPVHGGFEFQLHLSRIHFQV